MSENYIEQKEFARRASVKKVIEGVIADVFEDDSIKISEQGLIELISKKVS